MIAWPAVAVKILFLKPINPRDGIENSNKVIGEMLEGKRPSNQADALKLTKKIQRLLELTRTLIG